MKLVKPPRMADFTRLGEAMSQVLGHPPGTFDTLYKANRAEGASRSLESSPAAVAIRELVENYRGLSLQVFNGTMKSLLETLESYKQKSVGWPTSPRGLGDVLRRQKPAFNLLGIHIEISKPKKDGVHVTIEKKKGEHGEQGERGLDEKPPREKFTPLNSAAFKTESF